MHSLVGLALNYLLINSYRDRRSNSYLVYIEFLLQDKLITTQKILAYGLAALVWEYLWVVHPKPWSYW